MVKLDSCVASIELASIHFDQWILTVSLRTYNSSSAVNGMVALVFTEVRGFRYLDEGDMLNYPWPENAATSYFHEMVHGGWKEQEEKYGNALPGISAEYLISTANECLCVIANQQPVVVRDVDCTP